MKVLKIILVVAALVGGVGLMTYSHFNGLFISDLESVEQEIAFKRFVSAEKIADQSENGWYFQIVIKNIKPDSLYRHYYCRGVIYLNTKRAEAAIEKFGQAEESSNIKISANARLAQSTAIILAATGKMDAAKIKKILDNYQTIIKNSNLNPNYDSWVKNEAAKRVFWILAHKSTIENADSLKGEDGDKGRPGDRKRRGKALNEEFKRTLGEKKAVSGQ